MKRNLRRAAALSVTTLLASGIAVLAAPSGASAHGAMMTPGSRTYLCWQDGLTSAGAIQPNNPACAAAVAESGVTALYNWFAVLRSDGAGRTSGFIPDGQLCSAAATVYDFSGFDLARDDWPVTHLTSGASFNWKYNNWAAHPGTFSLYITKDTWSPTRSLAWSDLESTPFLQVTNPPQSGSPGTDDGHYYWTGDLPSGKSGRHLVYSVWARSDSQETFYGCSDVVFDGGNGEVTGVGVGGPTSPSASTPAGSGTASATPSSGSTNPATPTCSASYAIASSWEGGFQGTVTVTNSGAAAISGWAVDWTLASGQDVTQVWSGTLTRSGTGVSVANATWNGALGAGGAATFGFIGAGSTATPAMTCTAT
ncbi:MAG: chitin-binding protein [Dactylosporangium sp.]|nr:lytic polysaccharide monooxygenase [Dactylosporangium sp.]NNJ62525.1 chitin-binding protein [Dactylosporangium sp.]